jgi:hypothetical protein
MSLTKLLIKEHYPLALVVTFLIVFISSLVFLYTDLVDTENTIVDAKLVNCSKEFVRTRSGPGAKIWCNAKLPSGVTVPVSWYGQIKYPTEFPVLVLIEEKKGRKVGNKNYSLIGLQ